MPDPIENTADMLARARKAIVSVVVGHREVIDDLLLCLVAGGHALLDGPPGVGKSLVARAIASSLALRYARITMTPDLLPPEIVGARVSSVDERGVRHDNFRRGPLFAQLVFVDAIELGAPKTQAVVFDAMQDGELLVGGERQQVEEPYAVIATHAAPDAHAPPLTDGQRDRFLFQIPVARPDPVSVVAVLARSTGADAQLPNAVASPTALLAARAVCRTVTIRPRLLEWVSDMLRALDPAEREAHPRARETLRVGPGVRGGQAIALAAKAQALMHGAVDVAFEDIERVVRPSLRHRMVLTPEAMAAGLTADSILNDILPVTETSSPEPAHSPSLRPPPSQS